MPCLKPAERSWSATRLARPWTGVPLRTDTVTSPLRNEACWALPEAPDEAALDGDGGLEAEEDPPPPETSAITPMTIAATRRAAIPTSSPTRRGRSAARRVAAVREIGRA